MTLDMSTQALKVRNDRAASFGVQTSVINSVPGHTQADSAEYFVTDKSVSCSWLLRSGLLCALINSIPSKVTVRSFTPAHPGVFTAATLGPN
jgi:hypothetical protein